MGQNRKKLTQAIKDLNDAIATFSTSTGQQTADAEAKEEEASKARIALLKEEQIELQNKLAVTTAGIDQLKIKNELEAVSLEIKAEEADSIKDRIALEKKKEKALKKGTKELDKQTEAQKENLEVLGGLAANASGFLGIQKDMFGGFVKLKNALKDNSEEAKRFKKEISSTFSAGKIGTSFIIKAAEVSAALAIKTAFSIEDMKANYNKMTGRAKQMGPELTKAFAPMIAINADLPSALNALHTAFPTMQMADSHISSIGKSFATWQTFGVGVADSATAFAQLNLVFGKTGTEAIKIERNVIKMGRAMKKSPGEMMAAFKEALPRLAIYGRDVERNFLKISSAAAGLAVPTTSILDFTDSLKTIEGSAQFAAKLNSLLGRGVAEPISLMRAAYAEGEPLKALKMVRNMFSATGKEASSIYGAELDAFASAFNVTPDVFKKFISGKWSIAQVKAEMERLGESEISIARRSMTAVESIAAFFKGAGAKAFGDAGAEVMNSLRNIADNAPKYIPPVGSIAGVGAAGLGAIKLAGAGTGLLGGGAYQLARGASHGKHATLLAAKAQAESALMWAKNTPTTTPAQMAAAEKGVLDATKAAKFAVHAGSKFAVAARVLGGVGLAAGPAMNAWAYHQGEIGAWEAALSSLGAVGGGVAGWGAAGISAIPTGGASLLAGGAASGVLGVAGGWAGGNIGKWIDQLTSKSEETPLQKANAAANISTARSMEQLAAAAANRPGGPTSAAAAQTSDPLLDNYHPHPTPGH